MFSTSFNTGVGHGSVGMDKMLKFYIKVFYFYVLGKGLSGELSCTWTGFVLYVCVSLHLVQSDFLALLVECCIT